MMAMVQVRRPSAGQAYYRRKLAERKSPKEALRCLNGGCRMPPTNACWLISTASRAWSGCGRVTRPGHPNRRQPLMRFMVRCETVRLSAGRPMSLPIRNASNAPASATATCTR